MSPFHLPAVNDNGTVQLPLFTCGELASVITCVLATKARQDVHPADLRDFTSAYNKLLVSFMEQAQ